MVDHQEPHNIISERQHVIQEVNRLRETSDRPRVEGYTYDAIGAYSCEQGLSYHTTDVEPVIGYHVVDASLVPQGGAIDYAAYLSQRSSSMGGHVHRMIDDPILYRKINFAHEKADDQFVPAISFFMQDVRGGLQVTSAAHTLFRTKASFSHAEEPTKPGTQLQKLVNLAGEVLDLGTPRLMEVEQQLSRLAMLYAEARLYEAGIQPMTDEQGLIGIHRPLRVWADFKNLQLFGQVLRGELPLYDTNQIQQMQQRASGLGREAEPKQLIQSEAGRLAIKLLLVRDVGRYQLPVEVFDRIVTELDPDTRPDGMLVHNIMEWARRRGLFNDVEETPSAIHRKFQGLEQPVSIHKTPEEAPESVAYSALVTYLQRFSLLRSTPNFSRERSHLRSLQEVNRYEKDWKDSGISYRRFVGVLNAQHYIYYKRKP